MKNLFVTLSLILTTFCQSQSWDYLGNAGFSGTSASDGANYLSIAIDNQNQGVYVAFQALACEGKLAMTKYQGNNTWGQSVGNSNPIISCYSNGYANFIDLNIDDAGFPYLSYIDAGVGDALKIVTKNNNGTYTTQGTAGGGNFNGGFSLGTSIKKDVDNTLYMATYDNRLKFWKSGNWSYINITSTINITTFSFDFIYGSGYVAYSNLDDGGSIDIKKVTSAVNVAETYDNISDGLANYIDLKINPLTIQPYIAYQDIANGGGVTVKKLNGDNWELVGEEAFSGGLSNYIDLAFDVNGVPYVAFQDVSFSNKLSVMTYNGTTWEYVGERGVSPASASYCSIELNSDGEIFVAFKDGSVSNMASVLRFGAALSIDDNDLNNYVLSPNPANNKLTIDGVSDYDAKIFNNLGQFVMETTNTNTIDVSTLSKGIYFIKVSDGINSSTKKFIKN